MAAGTLWDAGRCRCRRGAGVQDEAISGSRGSNAFGFPCVCDDGEWLGGSVLQPVSNSVSVAILVTRRPRRALLVLLVSAGAVACGVRPQTPLRDSTGHSIELREVDEAPGHSVVSEPTAPDFVRDWLRATADVQWVIDQDPTSMSDGVVVLRYFDDLLGSLDYAEIALRGYVTDSDHRVRLVSNEMLSMLQGLRTQVERSRRGFGLKDCQGRALPELQAACWKDSWPLFESESRRLLELIPVMSSVVSELVGPDSWVCISGNPYVARFCDLSSAAAVGIDAQRPLSVGMCSFLRGAVLPRCVATVPDTDTTAPRRKATI